MKEKIIVLAVILAVSVLLVSDFLVIPQIFHKSSQFVTPVIGPIQPAAGYYLPYRANISSIIPSRIFVVSTNINSGFYPYPTRSYFNSPKGPPVVEKGTPCVIINVTIRNDYSAQNPPPNPWPHNLSLAWVFLTAEIFSGQNQINSTDLLRVGNPPDSVAYTSLIGGENATLSIYLGTRSRMEITSFQIVPVSIAGVPP